MIDPEVLDKIKRACSPQKAIYDIANYVETDVIPPINEATNTANAAAAQANSAYNRATDALNTANGVAADVSRSLIDLNAAGDGSTVTLNAPRNTGNPATAPLPVADATKAGVMNSATYVNLQNLNTRVRSLENQTTTYIVSFTNDNPTQDEINNAYKTAYPTAPFPPIDGTTVIDSTRQLYYRWVKNGSVWLKTTGFVISQFTNETAGTIKGSTVAGQIQAETDGTGSLVGYDTLVSNIAQNAAAIETANTRIGTVETKNTEQDTAINNVQSIADRAYVGSSIVPQANNVNINFTKGIGTPEVRSIPAVTTELAGIVTPAMFNQWNDSKQFDTTTGFLQNKDYVKIDVMINGNYAELFRIQRTTPTSSTSDFKTYIVNPNATDNRSGFAIIPTANGNSFIRLNSNSSKTLDTLTLPIFIIIGDIYGDNKINGTPIFIGIQNTAAGSAIMQTQFYVTKRYSSNLRLRVVREE